MSRDGDPSKRARSFQFPNVLFVPRRPCTGIGIVRCQAVAILVVMILEKEMEENDGRAHSSPQYYGLVLSDATGGKYSWYRQPARCSELRDETKACIEMD